MKLKMNRAIAGYILAGIAMLILLLYLRFPGEALTDYVKAVAAARYPEAAALHRHDPAGHSAGTCAFGMSRSVSATARRRPSMRTA